MITSPDLSKLEIAVSSHTAARTAFKDFIRQLALLLGKAYEHESRKMAASGIKISTFYWLQYWNSSEWKLKNSGHVLDQSMDNAEVIDDLARAFRDDGLMEDIIGRIEMDTAFITDALQTALTAFKREQPAAA